MPVITLPDGSQREFAQPITVAEVAQSIGAGLAKAALAGKVNGNLVDTTFLIDGDITLGIITDKDPEGVDIIRHSTAHLLARPYPQDGWRPPEQPGPNAVQRASEGPAHEHHACPPR